MTAFGIQFYEVARYILDAGLGTFLYSLPCSCAEGAQFWRFAAVCPAIFAYLIERMDAYINLVVLLVYYADDLLIALHHSAIGLLGHGRDSYQSGKLSYAEIYMHYEVAWLHLLQLFHGERHLAALCLLTLQLILVETLKYLMVSKEHYLQHIVDIAFVEGAFDKV